MWMLQFPAQANASTQSTLAHYLCRSCTNPDVQNHCFYMYKYYNNKHAGQHFSRVDDAPSAHRQVLVVKAHQQCSKSINLSF